MKRCVRCGAAYDDELDGCPACFRRQQAVELTKAKGEAVVATGKAIQSLGCFLVCMIPLVACALSQCSKT